jgi:diaminopimelate decarboxylase
MDVLPETAEIVAGRLRLGGVDAAELAREFGTPLQVYDRRTLVRRARAYVEALDAYPGAARAVFACKANVTVAVLREVFGEGLGADVASEGELAAALAAGADPATVVVHGNNKSDADLSAAVAAGCGLVVLDHPRELDQLDRIAADHGVVQRVLVRVTPGIEADTHKKIVTGHSDSKFGFAPADALDVLDRVETLANLSAAGLHVHLGSQIRDLRTYLDAIGWLANLIDQHGLGELSVLDLGGGFAVAHTEADEAPEISTAVGTIVAAVAEAMAARGLPLPELVLEPGRSIVGPAGVTLYSVGAIKQVETGTVYAAVDGGMSDNPRPTLYSAVYQALVADRADSAGEMTYTIAGKHCETGDVLIERAELPRLAAGDVLVVAATGAYTASMASNYNAIPRPAAVMVDDGEARLIVRRETVADLLARETGLS